MSTEKPSLITEPAESQESPEISQVEIPDYYLGRHVLCPKGDQEEVTRALRGKGIELIKSLGVGGREVSATLFPLDDSRCVRLIFHYQQDCYLAEIVSSSARDLQQRFQEEQRKGL